MAVRPALVPHQPNLTVVAVTRAQSRHPDHTADTGPTIVSTLPTFNDSDLQELQAMDPAMKTMARHISDPSADHVTPQLLDSVPGLKPLFKAKASLCVVKGLLVHVSGDHTPPAFVAPRSLMGVMLMHAHESPCVGHKGTKATCKELQQVAYWPHMEKDVADYVRGCLVCYQFQPSNPLHGVPLQCRGVSFPWSDPQIDWVGPLSKSLRGNKYWKACQPPTIQRARQRRKPVSH